MGMFDATIFSDPIHAKHTFHATVESQWPSMVLKTRIIEIHTLGRTLVFEVTIHQPALVPIPNLRTLTQIIVAVIKLELTPVKNTDALAGVDSTVYCKVLLRSPWRTGCNQDETSQRNRWIHGWTDVPFILLLSNLVLSVGIVQPTSLNI